MYLTFNEYQVRGGQLDNTAFLIKEKHCERLLNCWTQDRIQIVDEAIKDLMFEMVQTERRDVKTFSNDGLSVTYNKTTDDELYDLAVQYLPRNLICLGVELDDTII